MSRRMRMMLACYWSARRIHRYLDGDPSAPLTPGEVSRLEAHLAVCERCSQVVVEHRALHRALSRWSGGGYVDPASVDRVRSFLTDLTDGRTT